MQKYFLGVESVLDSAAYQPRLAIQIYIMAARDSHLGNNFDFLRFLAASLVIFSHAYPLTGRHEILASWIGHETLGGLAVAIFFIISGYLITGSYMYTPRFKIYFAKRVLRIYPGFLCSLLFCALLIGPLTTSLPLAYYFIDHEFYNFLGNIGLYGLNFTLPGVFANHPHTSVNGVYWTLPIEFTFYLIVALLGMFGLLKKSWIFILAALLYAAHYMITTHQSGSIANMSLFYFTLYGGLFMAGAFLYRISDRLPKNLSVCFLLIALVLACIRTPVGNLLLYLCLPYIVLCLAYARIPALHRFGKYGDFSYGLYLYGFPMQQLVLYSLGKDLPISLNFILVFSLSFILAVASWYLIEAPALKLKNRLRIQSPKR